MGVFGGGNNLLTGTLGDARYLQNNQTITLSGDISGSGATAITTTLPNIVSGGTNPKISYNAKGQVTAGAALAISDVAGLYNTNVYDANFTVISGTNVHLAVGPTLSNVTVTASTTTSLPLTVRGIGSQATNLLQIQKKATARSWTILGTNGGLQYSAAPRRWGPATWWWKASKRMSDSIRL